MGIPAHANFAGFFRSVLCALPPVVLSNFLPHSVFGLPIGKPIADSRLHSPRPNMYLCALRVCVVIPVPRLLAACSKSSCRVFPRTAAKVQPAPCCCRFAAVLRHRPLSTQSLRPASARVSACHATPEIPAAPAVGSAGHRMAGLVTWVNAHSRQLSRWVAIVAAMNLVCPRWSPVATRPHNISEHRTVRKRPARYHR